MKGEEEKGMDFFEQVSQCVQQLKSDGFNVPITWAGTAANGVAFAFRLTGQWNALAVETLLAPAGETLELPLRLVFVDVGGKTAAFRLVPS